VPVVLAVDGVTQELNEESVRKLAPDKDALQSPADRPVPGSHTSRGQGENGFRIVGVWVSGGARQVRCALLMPVLAEIRWTQVPTSTKRTPSSRRRRTVLGEEAGPDCPGTSIPPSGIAAWGGRPAPFVA
jgi:hypothetical protein